MLGLLTLRDDRHCVVVVLAVENHVETRLLELLHRDAVGALSEDLHLVDTRVLVALLILPFALSHGGGRDEAKDLDRKTKIVINTAKLYSMIMIP